MKERSIDELLHEIDRALHIRQTGDHESAEWRKASAELPELFEEVQRRAGVIMGTAVSRAIADLAADDAAVAAAIGNRVKVQLRKYGFKAAFVGASKEH